MPSRNGTWSAPPEPSVIGPLEVFPLDVLMRNPTLMQKPPAILPRLLYAQRVTMLAAFEKLGKSTFAGAAVAALSKGVPFLGEPTQRRSVLWGTEEHLGDAARRLVDMHADPEWVTIATLPFDGTIEQRVERLAETVRSGDFTVVVIDTLSVLMRGMKSHNDSAEMGNLMGPLVELAHVEGVALLLLHHANKSEGKYRGSTEVGARVDVIAEMHGDPTTSRRKLNVRGRYGVDEFSIAFDGETYTLAGGELSLDMRVRDYVIQNPGCSAAAIERAMGGTRDRVRDAVRTLVHSGRVVDRPEQEGRRRTHRYFPPLMGGAVEVPF